ncbi:hypothetical protein HIM_01969 [Hirsutella minnesotensis 3608]|nr:hypothetical protein HIM_01969 [Hirsutella minnesotensis 3608]
MAMPRDNQDFSGASYPPRHDSASAGGGLMSPARTGSSGLTPEPVLKRKPECNIKYLLNPEPAINSFTAINSRATSNRTGVLAPTTAQARGQAKRVTKRPSGGRVNPRPRSSGRSGTKRCEICGERVQNKSWADHKKVHSLQDVGLVVSEEKKCKMCVKSRRTCVVFPDPGPKGGNTMRCLCCIKYKETCSFRSQLRDQKGVGVHPALE